jgi:hypothetical protein
MGCDILWAYVPQAEVLVEALAPRFVVYHCVDDIAEQKGVDAAGFRAAEKRFAGRADLVLASAPALAERMRGLSANVLYAPNVADHELLRARSRRARWIPRSTRCRIRGSCSRVRSWRRSSTSS